MFAIQCWWAPRRTKQLSNVAILLYRFLSCWCLSRSISLADYCLSLHIFLADQISCKSHVGIVYRMRSLTVSRFSTLKGIRVLNKRSVSYGGNLCPLWLEILRLVWHSVGDTLQLRNSWPWAVSGPILCSLLCPETDWKIGVGNAIRLCVYFNWFQKGMFWGFAQHSEHWTRDNGEKIPQAAMFHSWH